MKPVLAAERLSVSRQPGRWIIREANLSLAAGELVGVIGPSGCGKSTLCLALAGLIPRQVPGQVKGRVYLEGQDLANLSQPQIAANLGIVFQDPQTQLFLPRARGELAFGPENLCLPRKEIVRRLEKVAREIGCQDLLAASPDQLSGGEQQLVALAAVLTMEPRVLILDEVTSQLDPAASQGLLRAVRGRRGAGTAVLMVEHNLGHLEGADRVYLLRAGRLTEVADRDFTGEEDLDRLYGGI